MAENENKNSSSLPGGIQSIGNEEALTEIDFGSFLADGGDNSAVIEGLHSDIEKTEKSLDDAIKNLYDSIMGTSSDTIVPRTLDEITSEEPEKEEETNPLTDMWMSPEEYIDIPFVSLDEEDQSAEEKNTAKAKDDLFDMIETLKTDTDSDKEFDNLLADIEDKPIEDIDAALSKILGDNTATEPGKSTDEVTPGQASDSKPAFTVNIPQDGTFYSADSLPELKSTAGIFPDEIDAEDDLSHKERKQLKKERKIREKEEAAAEKEEEKKNNPRGIVRTIILGIAIITIVISSGVLVNTYIIEPYKCKKDQQVLADALVTDVEPDATAVADDSSDTETNYPEGMLAKYAKLYDINNDMAGWISIPALDINLPIAQGEDNDYYLHRNIYKKWTEYGVTFFDYRISDLKNLPRNTVVYGHNMRYSDLIFGLLENYRDIETFQAAPVIECNTIYGDHTWFVYAVFITNSKASQDNGYLFPYNFIDVSETKFEEYIKEIDKRKLYTTGIDINVNDNILTLSTCCYDFDEARLVVVAREKRATESSTPDTSRASLNTNPKYPQAWYDANKKQNPYVDDARW